MGQDIGIWLFVPKKTQYGLQIITTASQTGKIGKQTLFMA